MNAHVEISAKPINIFLDFNAVIVNLDSLPPEKQKSCIAEIEENVGILKSYLEDNIREKENEPSIPGNRYGCFAAAVCIGRSNPRMGYFFESN